MPCYSSIQTDLIDIATIEKVAPGLGITVTRRNSNRYILGKTDARGRTEVEIRREKEGEKFSTVPGTQYGNIEDDLITPLTQAYAKDKIKTFAAKRGYTVSAGNKPGEYVLTSYK